MYSTRFVNLDYARPECLFSHQPASVYLLYGNYGTLGYVIFRPVLKMICSFFR